MAAETGLGSYVSPRAAPVALPHTDQSAESNASQLQRLAGQYNAWAKVSYGAIRFVDSRDVSPDHNPARAVSVAIDRAQLTGCTYGNKKRNACNAVRAKWQDLDAAQLKSVTVPADAPAPILELDTLYPNEVAARKAAESCYLESARDGKTLGLTLPTPAGMAVFADATLNLTGFQHTINGAWCIKTVIWTFSRSGLACAVQCETTTT